MDEKIKIAVRNALKLLREYSVILEEKKDFNGLTVRNAIKALKKLLE